MRSLTIGALRRFLNTLPLDSDDQEIHIFGDEGDTILTKVALNTDRPGIRFFQYGDEPCEEEEEEEVIRTDEAFLKARDLLRHFASATDEEFASKITVALTSGSVKMADLAYVARIYQVDPELGPVFNRIKKALLNDN